VGDQRVRSLLIVDCPQLSMLALHLDIQHLPAGTQRWNRVTLIHSEWPEALAACQLLSQASLLDPRLVQRPPLGLTASAAQISLLGVHDVRRQR
jgi:hypothetical protein